MLDVLSKPQREPVVKAEATEATKKEDINSPKKGKRKRSSSDSQMDTDALNVATPSLDSEKSVEVAPIAGFRRAQIERIVKLVDSDL